MTHHVSEECFNQHLFILSKGLESYLGIPWVIVQKEALHPKMLGSTEKYGYSEKTSFTL